MIYIPIVAWIVSLLVAGSTGVLFTLRHKSKCHCVGELIFDLGAEPGNEIRANFRAPVQEIYEQDYVTMQIVRQNNQGFYETGNQTYKEENNEQNK